MTRDVSCLAFFPIFPNYLNRGIYFRGLDVNHENRENNMSAEISCFTVGLDLSCAVRCWTILSVPDAVLKRKKQQQQTSTWPSCGESIS